MSNPYLQAILNQIVDRLSDTAASLDALEAVLIRNQQLTSGDIAGLFQAHKQTVEQHVASLRASIRGL